MSIGNHGRRLTHVCKTCGKKARPREMAHGITQWTPRCPKGHGVMVRFYPAPKHELGRKRRWQWMNGVRVG